MHTNRPAIPALTGLRAVAAYSVLLAHVSQAAYRIGLKPVSTMFSDAWVQVAHFGMSLFFVLSGFVIFYNYEESFRRSFIGALGPFFTARFARLYPLYLLVIISAAGPLGASRLAGHPIVLAAYATMTQSWFNMEGAVFPPAWSISTEWFFYALFPLAVLIVASARRPVLGLLAAIGCSMLAIATIYYTPLMMPFRHVFYGPETSAGQFYWFGYYNPFVRFPEFLCGAFIARFVIVRKGRHLPSRMMAPLVLVAVIVAGTLGTVGLAYPETTSLPFGPFWAVKFAPTAMVLVLAASSSDVLPMLRSRIAVFCGEISYGVYLLQFAAIIAVSALFLPQDNMSTAWMSGTVRTVVTVLVATLMGACSYRYIERPARRFVLSCFGFRPHLAVSSRQRHPDSKAIAEQNPGQ